MYSFYEVTLKSTFLGLPPNPDRFCFVKETGEIFLGSNLYGNNVVFATDYSAFPATGSSTVIYVAKQATTVDTEAKDKGFYQWDGTTYVSIIDTSGLTADGIATMTNKTMSADDNTITDLELDNFKTGVVETAIGATPTDLAIPTSKAVNDLVKSSIAGGVKFKGSSTVAEYKAYVQDRDESKIGHMFLMTDAGRIQFTENYIDCNPGDFVIVSKDPTVPGFFLGIVVDNSESGDLVHFSGVIDNIENGAIPTLLKQGSIVKIGDSKRKITTLAIDDSSTDKDIPTSKSVYDAINAAMTITRV